MRGGVSGDHGHPVRQVRQRLRPAGQDGDGVARREGQVDDVAAGGAGRTEDQEIHDASFVFVRETRASESVAHGCEPAGSAPNGHRTGLSKHPLADERDREALREMAAHGFRIRIATAPLPQGTVIIDRRTMILTDPAASTPGARTPRTYTMSGSPALIGGTYSLFEAAWESAAELSTFLDPRRPRMDARTAKVLHALVSGATDEAAARELGMSLRTYRRRVAELLVSLDAASRFQAGVRAGELGLIRG
ncbi:DNA-binding response regulator [Streptomyces sp. SP18BB07]|uniref:DNA-binding response regulator n=1 Tax=Streptomyces sp. SP18BB07 TaxID=3002522 RepID=UPI002E76E402|nr:DNA-binding response regulator [Streptomyces sp. SP18BB07]MEE1766558.1 DNA-binding response regulator [Streptomyces sp. SP18BB07]